MTAVASSGSTAATSAAACRRQRRAASERTADYATRSTGVNYDRHHGDYGGGGLLRRPVRCIRRPARSLRGAAVRPRPTGNDHRQRLSATAATRPIRPATDCRRWGTSWQALDASLVALAALCLPLAAPALGAGGRRRASPTSSSSGATTSASSTSARREPGHDGLEMSASTASPRRGRTFRLVRVVHLTWAARRRSPASCLIRTGLTKLSDVEWCTLRNTRPRHDCHAAPGRWDTHGPVVEPPRRPRRDAADRARFPPVAPATLTTSLRGGALTLTTPKGP